MATITRENISLLNDRITVNVSKDDYLPSFEKALKEYGKKANIPGFRKGMVPTGVIKKMYGSSVFADEVLRSVEKELTHYMSTEKLDIFAQPLPLPGNDANQIDMAKPIDYSFSFEVGLKPAFELPDFSALHPTRYKVEVTDEMINQELERLQLRHGKMTEPETVTGDDNVLNVVFTESDEQGVPAEGGIVKDNSLLVKYFNEAYRAKWQGSKAGDSLVLQPSQAFDEKEREWITADLGLDKNSAADADKYFKVEITKLGLVERAPLEEEFFNTVYPGKEIKTEADFREAVREEIQKHWDNQSRSQLHHTLYHELLNHTAISFPESFLKRWIQTSGEKEKSAEEAEHEFPVFANQLKWTLIVDKVTREHALEVQPDDIRAFAKQQLLGYMGGMAQLDGDQPWMADYVNRMMQDRKFVEETVHRLQTDKVFEWAETQVGAVEKPVSAEDFTHMQEEHQHHHHE